MKFLFPLARRFIAGDSLHTARPAIDALLDQGYEVTIDYVGEESKSAAAVDKAVKEYRSIILEYQYTKGVSLSIKPTQLGMLLNRDLCFMHVKSIVAEAKKKRIPIRLDMEDSRVTGDTIWLAVDNNIGVALQANHRSSRLYSILLRHFNIPVRLVKGAYKEPHNFNVQDTLVMFNYLAHYLSNVSIATHDEDILNKLKHHKDFEMLYGIRRDLQKKLKSDGKVVRIYVPYGSNWLPYALRRLREWKNLKFVMINMVKEFFRCTK